MAKKLSDIKDIPQPPADIAAQAKKMGISILAHDPNRVESFVRGHITLGELEGISKDAQYQMAKQGYSFMREGKLDQAKTVFEGLQALDPYDAYFHLVLGTITQEQGDLDRAEKLYTRSLEINPFSPVALAQRGEIRLGKGQFAEALADLGKSVQEDPEGNEPAARRARVLLQLMKQQLEASKADPAKAARDARLELQQQEANDPNAKKTAPKTDAKAPVAGAKPASPGGAAAGPKTDAKAPAAKPAAAAAKPAAPGATKTDAKAVAAKPAAAAGGAKPGGPAPTKTDAKAVAKPGAGAGAKPGAPAAAKPAAATDAKAAAAKPDPKAAAKPGPAPGKPTK